MFDRQPYLAYVMLFRYQVQGESKVTRSVNAVLTFTELQEEMTILDGIYSL